MARKAASAASAREPRPPVLEWVMGGLGLVLVIAVLAVILKAAAAPQGPPEIAARLVAARSVADGWRAEVEVRNTGDATAAQVEIEGRLGDETASAVVDYVAAAGRERVILGFDEDPRAGLTLTVRGWSEP